MRKSDNRRPIQDLSVSLRRHQSPSEDLIVILPKLTTEFHNFKQNLLSTGRFEVAYQCRLCMRRECDKSDNK